MGGIRALEKDSKILAGGKTDFHQIDTQHQARCIGMGMERRGLLVSNLSQRSRARIASCSCDFPIRASPRPSLFRLSCVLFPGVGGGGRHPPTMQRLFGLFCFLSTKSK